MPEGGYQVGGGVVGTWGVPPTGDEDLAKPAKNHQNLAKIVKIELDVKVPYVGI